MRLAEIDGKALLRRHRRAVARGALVGAGEDAPAAARQWPDMLKAVLKGRASALGAGRHSPTALRTASGPPRRSDTRR
jgi:hypothetical protein